MKSLVIFEPKLELAKKLAKTMPVEQFQHLYLIGGGFHNFQSELPSGSYMYIPVTDDIWALGIYHKTDKKYCTYLDLKYGSDIYRLDTNTLWTATTFFQEGKC
jgi:hypothetical protein